MSSEVETSLDIPKQLEFPSTSLRHSAAAVLVFFPAAARARFVTANLGYRATNWQIDRNFAFAVAISGCHSCHRTDGLTHTRVSIGSRRGWRVLAHQELWQGGKEILERLQV